jgi:hypothetical protein
MPSRLSTIRANKARIDALLAAHPAASHTSDGTTVEAVTADLSAFTLDDRNPVPAGPLHMQMEAGPTGQFSDDTDPFPTSSLCSSMEDVAASMNHLGGSAIPSKLSPMERTILRKERNNYTKRIRDIFTSVQEKATELQAELEDVARSPTHEKLSIAKSQLLAMQTTMGKYKRKTETLDKLRATLNQQLDASQVRIDELGTILCPTTPPEDKRPREYSNGKRQGWQCISSAELT